MPEEPYPTKVVDGQEYWVVETLVPKESDPERGAYIFFAKPLMGITGIAGLVKGDPGPWTEILEEVNVTPLAHGDETPDSMSFTVTQPGGPGTPQRVQLNATQRSGPPGQDGTMQWDPTDLAENPVAGAIPAVNADGDGFDLVPQKVGGMHWAASLNDAPAGTTATYQIGTIAVAAGTYRTPWRPDPEAAVTVTGSSPDIAVDIVARLNSPTGKIVGIGKAVPGVQTQRVVLQSGPETGASATDDTLYVAAGEAATVYLMAEKVGGAATYATSLPRFNMNAVPLP
ncbi:minor tail protein [Mycobacterium phage Che9c]|uniref:Minor tail protein n=1 Tax=Mycobacterium phage Che9c TaxID=2907832 RepID=Q854X9_9CAUD|nr:minor tail protein [Mycobacterium phage Che9c]AAN12579.1 hypothetical protein PBI_CHE9C_18 [Mycobacterium phage Che9c]